MIPKPTTRTFKGVHMIRHAIAILAACIAFPTTAQTAIQPSAPNLTETRTFALKSGGRLKIDNPYGGVAISAWDKDEVALTANFTQGSHNKVHLKIKVKSNINSLELTLKHLGKLNKVGSCQLELKVPSHAASSVRTRNASIVINGIIGKINAETRNGSILLKNVSGNINASTRNGSVSGNIQNVEDVLDISTRNGDISLKLLNPNGSFTASSRYRNISLPRGASDVKFYKSGNSTVRAKYDGKANMRFITRHGSITVQ